MKRLLTILFLLTAYIVNAQYLPNSAAYSYKGVLTRQSLQPPQGCGQPNTGINAPYNQQAAFYWDSCADQLYTWSPKQKLWLTAQSGIDSIFITTNDSIFIITSNNDTIFVGTGNPAVDTIYQRGPDSIFAVKAGIEFLAAVTGASAPSGGMDTAYSRNDSIFGVKNNGEFLISNIQNLIDSIFITNTDSIFIISGNDTIFIGNANNGGDSIISFTKNNTLDSIILLLRDGRRLAVKDEGAGGNASITLDSFYIDFDTTLGYQATHPISATNAKTIDISAESNDASGFVFGWNETEAVLTYQAGLKGIKKFYITYFR